MFARHFNADAGRTFDALDRLSHELKLQHIRAFDAVYTPIGCESVLPSYFLTEAELDQLYLDNDYATTLPPELKQHDNAISRITSFTGLKNRLAKDKQQSWLSIAKHFIGWQDDATPRRKIFNIVKAPIVLILNTLFKLIGQVKNVARLFTEYLPYLLYRYCMFGMQYAEFHLEWKSIKTTPQIIAYGALYGLALTGRIIFGTLFFIGQAVTSPVKNFKTAWKAGHDLADRLFISTKSPAVKKIVGHVIGGLLAALSLATTIVVYTFVMPLAMKALGSMAVSKMPDFISTTLQVITNTMMKAFGVIGNAVTLPIFGKIYSAMGVTISAGASGCAFVGSVASTAIRLVADKIKQYVEAKWYGTNAKSEKPLTPPALPTSERVSDQATIVTRLNQGKTPTSLERGSVITTKPEPANGRDTTRGRGYFEWQQPLPPTRIAVNVFSRKPSYGHFE